MKFDMHTHSTKSDGILSVTELLSECEKEKIDFLSITDHDCIDAYKMEEIKAFKGKIIRGAEFSADWDYSDHSIHVLGYDIDIYNEKIISLCEKIKQYRMQEFLILIKKLKAIGITVPIKELSKDNRMNIDSLAEYMYEHGYEKSVEDVNKKYFNRKGETYVPRRGNKIENVIEAIHSASGKAIFAHPWRCSKNIEELKKMIIELKRIGIDGVEAFSNEETDLKSDLIEICIENRLIYTAGSDFHGKEGQHLGIDDEKVEGYIKAVFIK